MLAGKRLDQYGGGVLKAAFAAAHFVSLWEGMERSEGAIETPPTRLQPPMIFAELLPAASPSCTLSPSALALFFFSLINRW